MTGRRRNRKIARRVGTQTTGKRERERVSERKKLSEKMSEFRDRQIDRE